MTPMNPSEPRNEEQETAPGTARAWGSEPPLKEPAWPGSNEAPEDAAMAPDGVGESTTRHGEDVAKKEGKEPGRKDTGTDAGPVQRPTGESSPRDSTAVEPPDDPDTAAPQSP
ncbi:hypothetical protein [Arthrobacter sp.]|uniref:hypothetical protein n=1 Tax=Arthrobacter sp. TaxID=1667 RepID=UPI0033988E92